LYNPHPLNLSLGFSVVQAVVRGELRSHQQRTSLLREAQLLLDTVNSDIFEFKNRSETAEKLKHKKRRKKRECCEKEEGENDEDEGVRVLRRLKPNLGIRVSEFMKKMISSSFF